MFQIRALTCVIRHDAMMIVPTHGGYSSNSSVTRHDAMMIIPTHGDYKLKFHDLANLATIHIAQSEPISVYKHWPTLHDVVKFF